MAERQADERHERQGQCQADVADVVTQEDRDQGAQVAAAADRRAGLDRRSQLVDRPGRDQEDQEEPDRGTDPVRDGPSSDQQQVDDQQRGDQQPAGPAQGREQDVRQRGAHRAARIGRGLIDRLGTPTRWIRRVVAQQAQPQEHDRKPERDQRSGSQRTLAQRHGTPSRRGAA